MGAAASLLSAMLGRENAPRFQVKYATHNTHGCPAGVFIIPLQGHESKAAWEAALRQQMITVDTEAQVGSAANKYFVYIRSSPAFIEALEAKAKESGFASKFFDTFLAAVDAAQQAIEAKKAAARAAEASGRKDPEQHEPVAPRVQPSASFDKFPSFEERIRLGWITGTEPPVRPRPERPDWRCDRTDGSFREESPGSSRAR